VGGISSQFRINPFTGTFLKVKAAHGATIETIDGKAYLDMFMAHGSTILGHAHPAVLDAIRAALEAGVVVGYETGLGAEVAGRISDLFPSAEGVRFTASGSEGVSTALRLARAHTKRDVIIKIEGHFNGTSDYAMVNSLWRSVDRDNPGGRPSRPIIYSGGIPGVVAETIVPVPWNDLSALEAAFRIHKDKVAALLMVPIDFNNGCLTPAEGYLAAAKDLVHKHGALLIFDEVLSSFKTCLGGAETLYAVTPDITIVAKALSSGVPLCAIGGRSDVMATLMKPMPEGAIQGGTFAGSALGLAAARATLRVLSEPHFYPDLMRRSEVFFRDLQEMFDRSPVPARVQWVGCMFAIYVGTRDPVVSYADMAGLDANLSKSYFNRCIEDGVYFHTDYTVSAAHSKSVLDQVLERMERATRQLS
jgi:glutamate-1-semialdehyde 2,1-aminomutase